MKQINVTFLENGEISTLDNNNLIFSSENKSVKITPSFPDTETLVLADYSKRVHIRTGNGGGDVLEFATDLLLESKYVSKGILYVQFELYKTDGTSILFTPIKVTIKDIVDVTGDVYSDGYIVTISAGTITALAPTETPTITNTGTSKDAIFNFGIPKGATFTPKVDTSGNISWTNDGGLSNPATINIKGDKGDEGNKGDTGYYYTPSIDENCNLSWSNNGGLSNPATVNIKGDKGDKGDKGEKGEGIEEHNTSETSHPDIRAVNDLICDSKKADVGIPLNIQTDGYYYYVDGLLKYTTGRQYAIVEGIEYSKVYKLTTLTNSSLIAGVIYYKDGQVKPIGYELLGIGSAQTYDKYTLTIPEECTKMIVQCSTLNPLELYIEETEYTPKFVDFVGAVTVPVGVNLVTGSTVTLSGFTGTIANGFSHAVGNGGTIQLYNSSFTQGDYILEFDVSYTAGECVKCGFVNDYKNLAYNGGSHIVMPIRNTDGSKYLYLESVYNDVYTITNITIRRITASGTDNIKLTINSTLNPNNKDNLGFWNVILGYDTFGNSVGGTRTIAIGKNALRDTKGGHRNIGIGTFAMSQMQGGEGNVSIGADSMLAVANAEHNVMVGREAGYNGTSLKENVGIGHSALFGGSNSSAFYNVGVGSYAGYKCTSHRGTFIGYQAGYNIEGDYGNTMIGFNTLGKNSGYDNTCVGKQADFESGIHNATAVGANAKATKSHQVVLGDSNVNSLVVGNKQIIFNNDGTVTWQAI